MADIRITGRMVNFSRISFDTNDHDEIHQHLSTVIKQGAYQGALVVIDSSVEQELIALIQLLLSLDLQPMAVIEGKLGDQARAIQFPVMPVDQPLQRIKPTQEQVVMAVSQTTKATEVAAPAVLQHKTSFHNEMLRTGQSLLEEHGDIILTATMNSGSEVIASGNIHIYGNARGRIIAGASGDSKARIFCKSLEAELVSIAGTFCVADDIPKEILKQPVHIYLNSQQELVFDCLEN